MNKKFSTTCCVAFRQLVQIIAVNLLLLHSVLVSAHAQSQDSDSAVELLQISLQCPVDPYFDATCKTYMQCADRILSNTVTQKYSGSANQFVAEGITEERNRFSTGIAIKRTRFRYAALFRDLDFAGITVETSQLKRPLLVFKCKFGSKCIAFKEETSLKQTGSNEIPFGTIDRPTARADVVVCNREVADDAKAAIRNLIGEPSVSAGNTSPAVRSQLPQNAAAARKSKSHGDPDDEGLIQTAPVTGTKNIVSSKKNRKNSDADDDGVILSYPVTAVPKN